MGRSEDWTEPEVVKLLSNHRVSDADLRALLPGRTTDAIAMVRSAIHDYHSRGRGTEILSQAMMSCLRNRLKKYICAVCGEEF